MSFDRVAKVYRLLEHVVFRDALQKARVAHLDSLSLSNDARVLILGDGDGRFLAALLQHLPDARVDVVEASESMIGLAQCRVPEASRSRVNFKRMDVFEFFPTTERYDLVVSHFFLDCFEASEVERLVERVNDCLRAGGEWLISDFQLPRSGFFRRLRAQVLLWCMYFFFRVTTNLSAASLFDPEVVIKASGLCLAERILSNGNFLRADRWVKKSS